MEEIREDNILRRMKKLSLLISVKIDQIFMENGLTAAQSEVLIFLLSEEAGQEMFSGDLHVELGISKAAVSMQLKKLRQKGYIILQTSSGDDRLKHIRLTDKARQMKQELDGKMKAFMKGIYRGFSEADYEQLSQLTDRMLENLNAWERTAGERQKIQEATL